MATDNEVRHNSVADNKSIGKIVIEIQDDFKLHLSVQGAMHDPAFLEMAHGYLRQYINRLWDDSWEVE